MILVYGLLGLAIAFVVLWRFWPDPEAAGPRDIREDDLLPLTKRDQPSHVLDVWAGMAELEFVPPTRRGRDDLVSMGEAIDRVIALAAALPPEPVTCVFAPEAEADEDPYYEYTRRLRAN